MFLSNCRGREVLFHCLLAFQTTRKEETADKVIVDNGMFTSPMQPLSSSDQSVHFAGLDLVSIASLGFGSL